MSRVQEAFTLYVLFGMAIFSLSLLAISKDAKLTKRMRDCFIGGPLRIAVTILMLITIWIVLYPVLIWKYTTMSNGNGHRQ